MKAGHSDGGVYINTLGIMDYFAVERVDGRYEISQESFKLHSAAQFFLSLSRKIFISE